nr:SRPBCC domain-containing protein [Brevibacillus sp. SYP-B805]
MIQLSLQINRPVEEVFRMFTVNEHLQGWLTQEANVEPMVGGRYELYWNPANKEVDSTIGCKVLAIEENKLLAFEWKGSSQFHHVMNEVRPLTHVMVFFYPREEGTEIHLLHTGWRDTPEWEEAREWFTKAWSMSFSSLEKYLNRQSVEKCCE